jgi:hypothetical protein
LEVFKEPANELLDGYEVGFADGILGDPSKGATFILASEKLIREQDGQLVGIWHGPSVGALGLTRSPGAENQDNTSVPNLGLKVRGYVQVETSLGTARLVRNELV